MKANKISKIYRYIIDKCVSISNCGLYFEWFSHYKKINFSRIRE